MRLKAKVEGNFYDKKNMYTWVFVNGIMTIANEETYNVTLKESYVHRIPYYEFEININKRKRDTGNEK